MSKTSLRDLSVCDCGLAATFPYIEEILVVCARLRFNQHTSLETRKQVSIQTYYLNIGEPGLKKAGGLFFLKVAFLFYCDFVICAF